MKPFFFIFVILLGLSSFMGGRWKPAAKLKIAQAMVLQLQADNQTLQEQFDQMKDRLISNAEKKRIERERRELASLRGEVAELRQKIKELTSLKADTGAENGKGEDVEGAGEDDPYEPSDYYSASLNVELEPGMTLITGGWQTSEGRRTFVFMTPSLETSPDGADFIQISTRVADLSQTELTSFHLQNMTVKGNETDQAGGFDSENARLLFDGIKASEDARMVSSPTLVTSDGKQAVIQTAFVQGVSDTKVAKNFEIGVIPVMTQTGSIQMNVAATITRPETPPSE